MKKLTPNTFMGYEIISYQYYIGGKRQIISYAYDIGKANKKEDYEFEAKSNKKLNTLRMLKKQIVEKNNIQRLKPYEIKNVLLSNHNDLIYYNNGKLQIYHKEDFNWLKNHIKSKYNYKIRLEGDEIKC